MFSVDELNAVAVGLVVGFVLCVAVLFGLNFSHHVSGFCLLIVMDKGSISDVNAMDVLLLAGVAGTLFYTTYYFIESWPLNAQGLYSYNHEQLRALLEARGRFVLGFEGATQHAGQVKV